MSDIPSYNSSHRAFLQAFFAKPVMTFESAKPILSAILSVHHEREVHPNDITFPDFDAHIHALNAALSPFSYEIRAAHRQAAGSASRAPEAAIYALVNAASDPQTQLATARAPDDIAFVKRVLDAMFDANNTPERELCGVGATDAVRLAKAPPRPRAAAAAGGATQPQTQVPGDGDDDDGGPAQTQGGGGAASSLTLERAEKVLEDLVDEEWLERGGGGWLSLAPRAVMELGGWLEEMYNDPAPDDEEEDAATAAGAWRRIKMCEGCKQIVTVGQRCDNQPCLCRFHDFCAQTFFRGQAVRRCPTCAEEWTGESFVGERARNRSRRSNGVGSRR